MSIYKKIASIMKDVGFIAKSDKNKQQGWAFRGIDTIYQECQSVFAKHEVIPSAEIMSYDQKEVQSRTGTQGWYLTAHVRVHFISDEGGTFMDTIATSTDYGDKVGGQAMSMAMKKAIIDVLMLPVNGADPDSEIKETVKPQPQEKVYPIPADKWESVKPQIKSLSGVIAIISNGTKEYKAKLTDKQVQDYLANSDGTYGMNRDSLKRTTN